MSNLYIKKGLWLIYFEVESTPRRQHKYFRFYEIVGNMTSANLVELIQVDIKRNFVIENMVKVS